MAAGCLIRCFLQCCQRWSSQAGRCMLSLWHLGHTLTAASCKLQPWAEHVTARPSGLAADESQQACCCATCCGPCIAAVSPAGQSAYEHPLQHRRHAGFMTSRVHAKSCAEKAAACPGHTAAGELEDTPLLHAVGTLPAVLLAGLAAASPVAACRLLGTPALW